jgi:hypothetical protein
MGACMLCLCLPHECGNHILRNAPRSSVIKNVEGAQLFDSSAIAAAAVIVTAGGILVMAPIMRDNAEANAILAHNDNIRTKAAYPEAVLLEPAQRDLGRDIYRPVRRVKDFFKNVMDKIYGMDESKGTVATTTAPAETGPVAASQPGATVTDEAAVITSQPTAAVAPVATPALLPSPSPLTPPSPVSAPTKRQRHRKKQQRRHQEKASKFGADQSHP